MKLPINHITEEDLTTFASSNCSPGVYQKIAIRNSNYPGKGSMFGVHYCSMKLNGEAGEFSDHLGKSWRDDGCFSMKLDGYTASDEFPMGTPRYIVWTPPLTADRRSYLLKELGDCLWYIAAICTELNISLAEVMMLNLKKLFERTKKKTQSGSGDDR